MLVKILYHTCEEEACLTESVGWKIHNMRPGMYDESLQAWRFRLIGFVFWSKPVITSPTQDIMFKYSILCNCMKRYPSSRIFRTGIRPRFCNNLGSNVVNRRRGRKKRCKITRFRRIRIEVHYTTICWKPRTKGGVVRRRRRRRRTLGFRISIVLRYRKLC